VDPSPPAATDHGTRSPGRIPGRRHRPAAHPRHARSQPAARSQRRRCSSRGHRDEQQERGPPSGTAACRAKRTLRPECSLARKPAVGSEQLALSGDCSRRFASDRCSRGSSRAKAADFGRGHGVLEVDLGVIAARGRHGSSRGQVGRRRCVWLSSSSPVTRASAASPSSVPGQWRRTTGAPARRTTDRSTRPTMMTSSA
jgi:hypothetical protein